MWQQFYQQINLHSFIGQINQMEPQPELLLDNSIYREYQDICSNPAKASILRRLRHQADLYTQNSHDSSYFSQKQTLDISDNEALNMYIQHVYHKYNIADPIDTPFHNTKNPLDSTLLSTPHRQTQVKQATTRLPKNTSAQKKLTEMRLKFKQDSNDIVSSVFHPAQSANRQRRVSETTNSRIAKQIGYKTRQKIHFKTHTNEDLPATQRSFHSEIPSTPMKQSKVKVRFSYNPESPETGVRPRAESEIPVRFRYCPMCEEVVLHGNILAHEAKCKPIQEAYRLPLKQLQTGVKEKVQRIKQQVQKQIKNQSDDIILKDYHNLNKSIAEWLDRGDQRSFQTVRKGYQKMALNQYDLVSKLRWFKGLHKTIVAEMSSSTN